MSSGSTPLPKNLDMRFHSPVPSTRFVHHTLCHHAFTGCQIPPARYHASSWSKTRVEQVHHCMIDTADILVYRRPVFDQLLIEGHIRIVRVAVTRKSTTTNLQTCPSCRCRASPLRRNSDRLHLRNSGTVANGDSPAPVT